MSNIQQLLKNLGSSTVVILGLGREGLSNYKFLRENFPDKKLFLIDKKHIHDLGEDWQKINKNDKNIKLSTNFDKVRGSKVLVIKSPGLSPTNPLVIQAKKLGDQITSNTKIFFELLETIGPNIKTIGVTGTKGKSTTTSMIYHVLNDCGIEAFLGGNIGIPPLSLWSDIEKISAAGDKSAVVVLEMSSHQLQNLAFSPSIAVILDISPEHLDYYDSFDEYIEAKSNIARFQTDNDLVVFNDQQKIPTQIANLSKAKQITFNFESNVSNNTITYQDETIIDIDQLLVIGKHNILNSIPSIIIAKELGCKTSDIAGSLETFKTLPHRLETVTNKDQITYINDSLSTTPESCIAAINSFNNSPIILIAGGYDRNLDFSKLAETISSDNIKHLVLLPDTGKKILDEVQARKTQDHEEINYTFATNMKEAVAAAKAVAIAGDIVLLSPASASFGHFENYQDRGDQFKKFVLE